jgi:membrane protein DedA with SNARE-associated domain
VEHFLEQYGLLAVYFGMWVEGETVLVIAGFLVHQGLLPIWEVYLVAVTGAMTVDHLVYGAGRLSGRLPLLKGLRAGSAESKLARLGQGFAVFLGVRFVYGTRSPYLFYMGTRGLPYPLFAFREVTAVSIWAFAWLFFGHLFGHLMTVIYGRIHHHHIPWIISCLAVSGTALAAYILLKKRRKPNPERSTAPLEKPGRT